MLQKFRGNNQCYFKLQWPDSGYFSCKGFTRNHYDKSRVYYIDKGSIFGYSLKNVVAKHDEDFRIELKLADFFDIKDEPTAGYTKTILNLDELVDVMCRVLKRSKYGDKLDSIDYIFSEEVTITDYVKKNEALDAKEELINSADRFIIRIDKPIIEREVDNSNTDTFDFIRVNVCLPGNQYLDREDIKAGVKKHYREICKRALEKIQSDAAYKKFEVPVNALKLGKMTIVFSAKSVELLFELKEVSDKRE